ncbi:MAG: hypothetical protein WCC10_03575 [Tumebacillaceae bacterium]
MVMKALGYLGMGVLLALLIQTMVTTYHLGKIDAGLRSSLESTAQLAEMQRSIILKNQQLSDVVATTQAMDKQLKQTLGVTQELHGNISSINKWNGATLELNQQMVASAGDSGEQLKAISGGMGQLKETTTALYGSLAKLSEWIKQDRAHMSNMRSSTEQMNQKVPGVGR